MKFYPFIRLLYKNTNILTIKETNTIRNKIGNTALIVIVILPLINFEISIRSNSKKKITNIILCKIFTRFLLDLFIILYTSNSYCIIMLIFGKLLISIFH